ncbi:preprotein translocase subunit SecD [Pseudanabaena minima]|uniref:preprotein translocase subunit SecD n=1 Tax=Pseudanabaena minima TaxID=890415 RepID=UPI003DA7C1B6
MNSRKQLFAFVLTASLGACISPSVSQPLKPSLSQQNAVKITLRAKIPKKGITKITPQMMERARLIFEKRVNGLGISGASVEIVGNNQLVVKLPSTKDPTQAKRVIGTTGKLDFRKQKKGTENELRARFQVRQEVLAQREVLKYSGDQMAIAANQAALRKSTQALRDIFESPVLSGDMIKDAYAEPLFKGSSTWQIVLTFNDKGTDLFTNTTREIAGTGRAIGIFLDDELISSPIVGAEYQGKGITGGRAVIAGQFTKDMVTEIALQLRSGALPISFEVVETHSF